MVRMLVGNQYGIDLVWLLADRGKALREFLEAKPGVDQNSGFLGGDQRAVSGTAAREHAEFDDGGVLSSRSWS